MKAAMTLVAMFLPLGGCLDSDPPVGEFHPTWGELARSAADADWFVLEVPASAGGAFGRFEVPVRPDQVYVEGDRSGIILEAGIWDSSAALDAFGLVADPGAGAWTSVLRSRTSTRYSNDTLAEPTVLDRPMSLEPFHVVLDDPARLDSFDLILGAAGPASLHVLLSIVASNPQEPVPADTPAGLLARFKARGDGWILPPERTGHGFKVVEHEQWTLAGPFGREQGVRSNGELVVDAPAPAPVGQAAPLGPFQARLPGGTWSGRFDARYGVTPAAGTFEEQGRVFGQDVARSGVLQPSEPGLSTEKRSPATGPTEWSLQVTRVGVPDVETLTVQALLFGEGFV